MSYKLAVVGATGNVGREILSILRERNFPLRQVVPVASARSAGKEISFGDDDILTVQALDDFDFTDVDVALFSPGASVSKDYAPKAAGQGCVVIDNTSYFRMHEDIPLVVPEVNGEALATFRHRNIIANPNCSTAQMVVALKPLHDAATIKRVVVATYQSVSGAGKEAMDELYSQTKGLYMQEHKPPSRLPARIAFNVIPQIDVFLEDGSTKEEWKMVQETKKILDPAIEVIATCVRVPVFVGHSEALTVEFEEPLSATEARELLENAPGVTVVDEQRPGGYTTPVESAGEDAVFVSRIREDRTVKNGLALWVVSDNLRKGAALNAIQIAEMLISDYGLAPKPSR
ncbi:MAG: aspartate-semialdehyde dehydrogenase [Alphaproteobacteria bacterium]|nr:aspartate-semialdehyde dehydrogenase [Alphaproteobacteria bacterium]